MTQERSCLRRLNFHLDENRFFVCCPCSKAVFVELFNPNSFVKKDFFQEKALFFFCYFSTCQSFFSRFITKRAHRLLTEAARCESSTPRASNPSSCPPTRRPPAPGWLVGWFQEKPSAAMRKGKNQKKKAKVLRLAKLGSYSKRTLEKEENTRRTKIRCNKQPETSPLHFSGDYYLRRAGEWQLCGVFFHVYRLRVGFHGGLLNAIAFKTVSPDVLFVVQRPAV